MTRNDSALFTGMNSSSIADTQRTRLKEAKGEKRAQLTPSAVVINEEIDKMRKEIFEQLAEIPITLDTREEDLKLEMRTLQRNLQFIEVFRVRLANTLRRGK